MLRLAFLLEGLVFENKTYFFKVSNKHEWNKLWLSIEAWRVREISYDEASLNHDIQRFSINREEF